VACLCVRSHLSVCPCLFVCLFICLQCSNFWRPWPRKFIFGTEVRLLNLRVTFTYQGHWIKVKVTRAKKRKISSRHFLLWRIRRSLGANAAMASPFSHSGMTLPPSSHPGRRGTGMCRLQIFDPQTDRVITERVCGSCAWVGGPPSTER